MRARHPNDEVVRLGTLQSPVDLHLAGRHAAADRACRSRPDGNLLYPNSALRYAMRMDNTNTLDQCLATADARIYAMKASQKKCGAQMWRDGAMQNDYL